MPDRCFALTDKGFCSCIRVKVCPGKENCRFYKSEQQADEDLIKSYQRLCKLPMEVQKAIIDNSTLALNAKKHFDEYHGSDNDIEVPLLGMTSK